MSDLHVPIHRSPAVAVIGEQHGPHLAGCIIHRLPHAGCLPESVRSGRMRRIGMVTSILDP